MAMLSPCVTLPPEMSVDLLDDFNSPEYLVNSYKGVMSQEGQLVHSGHFVRFADQEVN